MAENRWTPIFLGQTFVAKTDQESLKIFWEQKASTPTQQKWILKLLVYDFQIEYEKGKENKVADALSKKYESETKVATCVMMISGSSLE